jgi:methyltransferase (TIGR00027 family)
MRPTQSSVTAEHNAVLRTYESMRPERARICSDPYAACFVPDRFFPAAENIDPIGETISIWESHFPGVCNAILARTRFIDDCLEAAIRAGIRQLVILGAGYDTRALRFEALKDGVAVFELDHPITQRAKLERIQKYVNADLSHVRYIPIDFSKDSLAAKLLAHGYDGCLTTLFIWEGVTYYLSASAVDDTLLFIRRHTGVKSSVVFDFFPPSVADGTSRLAEARALRDGLKRIGEEIRFGIAPDRIVEFMTLRGFIVLQNVSSDDVKARYLRGTHKNRPLSEMFLFVQAGVG